jgi:hypothetical protein
LIYQAVAVEPESPVKPGFIFSRPFNKDSDKQPTNHHPPLPLATF